MNHLEGSAEVEVTDEAAGGEVNESVEADLEHPEVEEQQQRYAGRPGRGRAVEDPRAPPGQQEDEERGECLARSASTESGFHNHTDTAEGDVIAAARDGYDAERAQDPEDESAYAVQYRPEAEEYTEQAEAEHAEATHRRALPNHLHFHSLEHEEAMNAAYSGYVYTHRLFHRGEDEPYAEPYADYGGLQEHVYEEIGDAPELEARDGLRLYEQERDEAAAYRQEALGARLHHYDERSDGESDSPEKEAEFAPYPRMDSYEQEEDIDQIVAEVKQSMSSQSLDKAAEDMPEAEQDLERAPTPGGGRPDSPELQALAGQQRAAGTAGGEAGQRYSKEKRDAISLAIKDIKEAIEEVKTRTIRSPYTPDEPKEPIWVMRQDISPTRDCDDQRPVDGDSPSPGSSPPLGAESSSLPLHPSDPAEASSNKESRKSLASFPTYVEVPGPCDPEDLIDGIIFAANYLGSTQLLSDKTPSKNVRMMQAQEAVSRIKQMAQKLAKSRKKAPEGESQPMTEVDLFISTQRIKVLNADTQETMMDHPLRTISYIADIGNIVVLMARRRMPRSNSQENVEASHPSQDGKRQYKMICHVFESEDAQLIAQSIGQAFSVAYQEFLRANGINPEDLSQKEYSDLLNTQDMYNDDLIHFSKSENCKDVFIEKQKGEILGVVIVESGWGSILPTVIIANMMHGGPAEKSGKLNIGDQIMSINGTSLVGLPLSTCQSIIKGLKNQPRVKLNIVRCPPVTTVLIRRPDLRYQLGFSVQNGIICSLMRGGIAERGGVRVGHRIIEINGQSVVATPHEKIVHILSNAVGEIHMKTMPAAMYRLLTAQEQPVYI
ncbi:amyloid-beta A4 precursor protein-binding family A member 1 isoform X1 [Panthera pardus]|uniref:Amyloid-beta A4 precursor protein-binding family A member 1 isoform X1 n=1 Tax=Panthera pardus TaxID=9691 RepID=A0A9V1GC15_PANPR|nr:amyloid-beta A4 precursor protein-binding family A member 1 isoform X1 [Panthera pardus]XP_053763763.1 amyloid-beta A4 precursor protein-binding family A member 1 isoform X1 [Panthera pardus]XP_053763764.1 amyloid-beta A4 precursor protein-binding family A member 1 isoform X1 [Panthera pardus]XP_060466079.1 amyloid-beta A4 precursor protein-binding family A member 1 isoform X1 [Panthera onca]XP_060466080.1 amyloid-beta A4 precursor protein-binding family A member 1 isoform X1 [Panthera onca]